MSELWVRSPVLALDRSDGDGEGNESDWLFSAWKSFVRVHELFEEMQGETVHLGLPIRENAGL